MSQPTRDFVTSAPCKTNRSIRVPIVITDMNAGDALWWDVRFGPHHSLMPTRADRFWLWATLLPFAHFVQLAQRRFCRPLVIWAEADNGRMLRVGMSIMIERYPHLDISDPNEAQFVWFMSVADDRMLTDHFQMSKPPSLARIHLDAAMVLSANAGQEGRVDLHAARAGGEDLLSVYLKCGLFNLPARASFPPSVRRRNDGRFFHTDTQSAATSMQIHDPYR